MNLLNINKLNYVNNNNILIFKKHRIMLSDTLSLLFLFWLTNVQNIQAGSVVIDGLCKYYILYYEIIYASLSSMELVLYFFYINML